MQPVNTQMKKLKNHSQTVWLFVCLLAILAVATATVVGSCLYNYAHRSNCEISLYQGELVPSHKTNARTSVPASTIQSRAVMHDGEDAQNQLQQYAFNVTDTDQVWTTETTVELFQASYENKDGVVTVQSADGSEVIAPGTEGSYTFALKNTSELDADYKVWVETTVNATITGMPLQTRMSGHNGWLLGGADSWQQAGALDGVSTVDHIDAGDSAEYTIYWQWPFEQDIDEVDTNMGNITVGQRLTYTVTIHTLATESTNQGITAGTDDTKHPSGLWNKVKTGDSSRIIFWCGLLVVAAVVVLLIVFLKKKKDSEKNQTD